MAQKLFQVLGALARHVDTIFGHDLHRQRMDFVLRIRPGTHKSVIAARTLLTALVIMGGDV